MRQWQEFLVKRFERPLVHYRDFCPRFLVFLRPSVQGVLFMIETNGKPYYKGLRFALLLDRSSETANDNEDLSEPER